MHCIAVIEGCRRNGGGTVADADPARAPAPAPGTASSPCAAEEASEASRAAYRPQLPARSASQRVGTQSPPSGSQRLRRFWRKFHGAAEAQPALRPPLLEAAYAGAAAMLAICALAGLHALSSSPRRALRLEQLVPPFGASAVLVFATPTSPLAQPRNLVGGNTLSALVGVAVGEAFRGELGWLAAGVAVGAAILLMGATGCTHPPAGAMALAALAHDPDGRRHSFLFVLTSAASGSCVLLLLALLANNLHPHQTYPQRWW